MLSEILMVHLQRMAARKSTSFLNRLLTIQITAAPFGQDLMERMPNLLDAEFKSALIKTEFSNLTDSHLITFLHRTLKEQTLMPPHLTALLLLLSVFADLEEEAG